MSTAVRTSLEGFMARPDREDDQCEELIDGEIVVSPSAKVWHAAIVDRIRRNLTPLEPQGYRIVNDFACILGATSMPAPDLAVVSTERWNQAEDSDGWLDSSPELVVEVASPSNRRLRRKAALYLEHGAEQVWLVYRKTRTVTVMTPEESTESEMGDSLQFHGVVFTVNSIISRNDK